MGDALKGIAQAGEVWVINSPTTHVDFGKAFELDATRTDWLPIEFPPTVQYPAPANTVGPLALFPHGGLAGQHLAKQSGANQPFNMQWVNASEGLVVRRDCNAVFEASTNTFLANITHGLGYRFVNVSVVEPGDRAVTPAAHPHITIVPRVEYRTDNACWLHFVRAVTGTAIIRR